MRVRQATFDTLGGSVLVLGYQGENEAARVEIDCREALEEYAGSTAALSITDPEGTVYPGDISIEDGIVSWVVKTRDTSREGKGSARIDIVDDAGIVAASAEAVTIILRTNATGIVPDAIADWTDAACVALEHVKWAFDMMMAAGSGLLHFELGEDGHLYMYRTDATPYMFALENGELMIYGQ